MRNTPFVCLLASLILSLAACEPTNPKPQQTADREPDGSSSPTADPSAGKFEFDPRNTFVVVPDRVDDCGTPVEATVEWDVRGANPEVKGVEIWVGTEGKMNLFGQVGSYGETKTGAWNFPGSITLLKDQTTGKQLAKMRMGGPICGY